MICCVCAAFALFKGCSGELCGMTCVWRFTGVPHGTNRYDRWRDRGNYRAVTLLRAFGGRVAQTFANHCTIIMYAIAMTNNSMTYIVYTLKYYIKQKIYTYKIQIPLSPCN